jgi:hypothetical protein
VVLGPACRGRVVVIERSVYQRVAGSCSYGRGHVEAVWMVTGLPRLPSLRIGRREGLCGSE